MGLRDQIAELLGGGNPMMPGQIEAGNISDLGHRESVWNPDEKGFSTVFSEGVGTPQGEVLIPRVAGGKILTSDAAYSHYKKTGQHLGKFSNVDAARQYGEMLHRQQEMSPLIRNLLGSIKF